MRQEILKKNYIDPTVIQGGDPNDLLNQSVPSAQVATSQPGGLRPRFKAKQALGAETELGAQSQVFGNRAAALQGSIGASIGFSEKYGLERQARKGAAATGNRYPGRDPSQGSSVTLAAGHEHKLGEQEAMSEVTRAHGRVPQPDRIRQHAGSIEESKESFDTRTEGKKGDQRASPSRQDGRSDRGFRTEEPVDDTESRDTRAGARHHEPGVKASATKHPTQEEPGDEEQQTELGDQVGGIDKSADIFAGPPQDAARRRPARRTSVLGDSASNDGAGEGANPLGRLPGSTATLDGPASNFGSNIGGAAAGRSGPGAGAPTKAAALGSSQGEPHAGRLSSKTLVKDPFASLDSYDPTANASKRQGQDKNRQADPKAASGAKQPAAGTAVRQPTRPTMRMGNAAKKERDVSKQRSSF